MRLFIGIAPNDEARQALAQSARAIQSIIPGRYVNPDLYHLTLAFLGEMDEEQTPQALHVMAKASADIRPFQLRLGKAGFFGSVLWRGLEENATLFALSGRLRAELTASGIPFDPKPLAAHITLARDAIPRRGVLLPDLPDGGFPVDTLILFESTRDSGTLCYRARGEVVLT